MATQNEQVSATELAQEIDDGRKGLQVEQGSTFARALTDALRRKGWRDYETHSSCKVASYEAHLQKGNRHVEIISSAFMGVFTDIRCYTVDRD